MLKRSNFLSSFPLYSPWYNRTGWLRVKHQVPDLLSFVLPQTVELFVIAFRYNTSSNGEDCSLKRCGSGLTFAKNRGFVSGSNVVKVDGWCICLVNCSRHRRDWTGARLQQSLRLCNLNSISTLLHNYFCYYGPKIYTEFVSPSRDQNEAMHSFTCSFCDFPSLPAMPSPTISVPSPVNKNDGVLMIFVYIA